MRSAARPAPRVAIGRRGLNPGYNLVSKALQSVSLAAVSCGFLGLVWLYGNGLRDPRYLDGWVLAGGMGLQLGFHVAIKTRSLSPMLALRWRRFHIVLGYLLIAAFVSHCDFSLPETGFEWALWASFVLVTLSGIFGTYLSWSLKAKRRIDEGVGYDRIETRRVELAREIHAVVIKSDRSAPAVPLPAAPHDAWIADLYTTHVRDFFRGPRNFTAHLIGSERPVKLLTDEIDKLSRYVDQQGQDKLANIKSLVVEKDRLDFARVFHGLTRGWLLLHVPATYALIVLTVFHVIVVYAFSSGAW